MFSYLWYGACENLVVTSVGLKCFNLLGFSSSSRVGMSSLGCVISVVTFNPYPANVENMASS